MPTCSHGNINAVPALVIMLKNLFFLKRIVKKPFGLLIVFVSTMFSLSLSRTHTQRRKYAFFSLLGFALALFSLSGVDLPIVAAGILRC